MWQPVRWVFTPQGLDGRAQGRGIAILTINNPPLNALSPGVPEGILAALAKAQDDAAVRGIVLIGGGRTFIAGADIKEFGKMTSGQKKRDVGLQPMLMRIEDCPKAVV